MDTEKIERNALKTGLPKRRYRATDPDFVAPDGGWGWLIVLACGFSNLCVFPVIQQFGLVFLEKFDALEITATQTATIINVNSALTSCVGLFNGPIYRKFSFRQVALFGSFFVVVSLFFTTFSDSFWSYLIFCGILYGSGVGITQTANAIALNTYFKQRRSIATGLSWGTTAFGPILLPHIITGLLYTYGTEGTLLLFSGFALHSLVLSLLLQPVHWHTTFRKDDETTVGLIPCPEKEKYVLPKQEVYEEKFKLWRKIANAFDLDLLKDPVYINIMMGMTFSKFCEMNFAILTPFILKEFNFTTHQIATFLSVLGATDIVMRFSIPFIGNKFGLNVRIYFMIGMLCTALGRIVLIHVQDFTISLISAVLIGFGKGLCVVYLALLIPNHVSLQKLPAATGLQLATIGVLFLLAGPLIGWIRDTVENYVITLHVLNILNYATIISWSIELIKTKRYFESR